MRTAFRTIAAYATLAGGFLMAGGCGGRPVPADPPDPMQVVNAERAFSRAGSDSGVAAAFSAFIAPDGVLFRPDPVNGPEWLAEAERRTGPPHLVWWPVYAGIALSGDLGFTTGPWTFGESLAYGFYFTIWRRQEDGTWKFVLDHGPAHAGPSAFGRDARVTFLPASTGEMKNVTADIALRRVHAHETTMATELQSDARAAYRKWLTPDALMLGSEVPPELTPEAQAAETMRRPETVTVHAIGGGASAAGDLVYTYGDATWTRGRREVRGHYVRLWQFREGDWRIVVDEVVEVPEG